MKTKISVVVGGQFGSEAKGHVCAQLTRRHQLRDERPLVAIRVAGPNAGHSAVDREGNKWALRQLPVAAVIDPDAILVIADGSEIDPPVLEDEIMMLESAGFKIRDRLWVSGQATIVENEHKARETEHFGGGQSLVERIGSTGKGIGAARADRIMRHAKTWAEKADYPDTVVMAQKIERLIQQGAHILIEGTQGFGLGLHAGFYPKCTSSDCRAIDFLSMAGISPWHPNVTKLDVWVVCRTWPIRVAGDSGELAKETTWDMLGERSGGYIKPEYTTVTKKLRRVGAWNPALAQAAVVANGGGGEHGRVKIALMFADYLDPDKAGVYEPNEMGGIIDPFIRQVEKETGARVRMVGTGPGTVVWVD